MRRVACLVFAFVAAGCHKETTELPRGESHATASSAPAVQPGTRGSAATAAFWTWFADHATELANDSGLVRAMTRINDQLQPTHPGIFVELGVEGQRRTLVITADGDRANFAMVQAVYRARPMVAGWNIVAFRQRDNASTAIEIDGASLDPATMTFVAGREGDKLSIRVYVPAFAGERMKVGLYVVLDHIVGEYDMETRIGGIDFAPIEKAPATAQPLRALPALIDATFPK